jgi:aspartate/methionine/tyrosine aminotransferase
MPVSRLAHIPGIGVDEIGDAADATGNPDFLRLENLDTDVPPPAVAREITHAAVEDDDANSYLPFQGHRALREAASEHVGAATGSRYDPGTQCVSVAGGLNGILNVLLATVEPRAGSRHLRSDLCRAGQPHPAGRRDSPVCAMRSG